MDYKFPTQASHNALWKHAIGVRHVCDSVESEVKEYAWKLQKAYDNLTEKVHSDSMQENLLSEYYRAEDKLYKAMSYAIPACGGPC